MTNRVRTEIVFDQGGADSEGTRVVLTGLAAGAISDPHKLQELLKVLGLPDGASARILYTTDDVVVR